MIEELRKTPVAVFVPSFGISAFRSRHAVGFHMATRRDVYDKILFVEAGQGTLKVRPARSELEQNLTLAVATAVHIPAGIPHQIVDLSANPMTLSVICLRPSHFEGIPTFEALWASFRSCCALLKPRRLSNPYSIGEFKRMFRGLVVELGRNLPHRDAAALSRVIQIITLLTRELRAGDVRIRSNTSADFDASLAYLDDHFTEPLQVETLARMAGLSYRAFTNRFRNRKGMTTAQYWNFLRIELAKRRLLETQDILGSATDAGFHDLSHFYKVFKRLVGETPLGFMSRRENVAGND